MLPNRFSIVVLAVIAIALITLLSVNAYLEQQSNKQTILVNAAREACLDEGHDAQAIPPGANPDTYYPLPPGKQTALVNAAIQACIDAQLSASAGK